MNYKFSPKQVDVLKSTLKGKLGFINILEGSVRSGKTFSVNLAWTLFVINSPYDKFLMSGESTDSLYRNVIGDIIFILGEDRAIYQESARGGAQLIIHYNGKTKICYCRGGSKSNDEGKIRGITIGGWYADEITLHHESFVKQALARMSLVGAKAIWTTNSDSPYHYIKTEYIEKANEKNYRHWHFELDDNLTLSEEYKENIKNAYAGLFYKRFILGMWVISEGVIYDIVDKNKHIFPTISRKYTQKYVSIDYGTLNPTAFGMYGKDITGQWYKIKEYHYSGRDTNIQKTDSEYADDLEEFVNNDKSITIIVDPSAASFIAELRKREFKVRKAKNDVLEGIREVGSALKNGLILFNDCNIETFKEFETYIWDEKASLKGEDKPIKEHDHHLDNLRYFVATILFRNSEGKYNDELYQKGKGVVKNNASDPYGRKGGTVF
ncbi:PBSX family phage terminase large subunit [Clostridium botulinum]|nr:PBSX family phage terminase large subunit [Clostridium botulinum]